MNFFRSFWGTCCGPYVFNSLRENSLFRVLAHLFLICLLCAIGVGLGNFLMVRYKWRAAYNEFNDTFGTAISFSEKGVLPKDAPDVSRRQELPWDSLLIYVAPDSKVEEYPAETLESRNCIILWSPSCIAAYFRNQDRWIKVVQYDPDGNITPSRSQLKYDEMEGDLLKLGNQPASSEWRFPEEYEKNGMSSQQLFYLARLSYAVVKAFGYFILSLGHVFFITLVFSAMFKLFSVGGSVYSFTDLWKFAIYAAFPVIFVVNIFPTLQLPGTRYFSWLFMIGWIVYLFVVLKHIFTNHGSEDGNNNGEADERA